MINLISCKINLLESFQTELLSWLPLFFLYAEIHYRIAKFRGRLFQRLPEIIADTPHRLNPGQPLPILVIVKDAYWFPVTLQQIRCEIRQNNKMLYQSILNQKPIHVQINWWERIYSIQIPNGITGAVQITVYFEIKKGKKNFYFCNDNYKGTSHSPFQTNIAADPLPLFAGQIAGDLHVHSNYTSDQVEFGASIKATRAIARAVGLSFFAVTDHSYDLDDDDHNYLQNNSKLPKWQSFLKEIEQLNINQDANKIWIIAGEEVSARNYLGRNIHFLLLNPASFYPGSGDSAERWLQTRSESSIQQILSNLPDETIAMAAHPFVQPPKLEYILLRRGHWGIQDISHSRLDGLQILNGKNDRAFQRGIRQWRKGLLQGQRLFIYGGNDSHGNLNRFLQIKLPFWSMIEHQNNIFGKMRTVVCCLEVTSIEALLAAIHKGRCYISDGPAIDFTAGDSSKSIKFMGDCVTDPTVVFRIQAKSTPEFGNIRQINIWLGDLIQKKEYLFKTFPVNTLAFQTKFRYDIHFPAYFRIEVQTKNIDDFSHFAYSNPIWVYINRKNRR